MRGINEQKGLSTNGSPFLYIIPNTSPTQLLIPQTELV